MTITSINIIQTKTIIKPSFVASFYIISDTLGYVLSFSSFLNLHFCVFYDFAPIFKVFINIHEYAN